MPTKEEFEELINNCDFEDYYLNGIRGTKVISRVHGFEGRYIFFPNTGFMSENYCNGPDIIANFWTSSLDNRASFKYKRAYYFQTFFNTPSTVESHAVFSFERHLGLQIRAVCPKN